MHAFRIGADENGLGAQLGPLIVTAVLARVDERGNRTLSRKLPKRIREDLDDSKRLVSHGNVGLAEGWARVLVGNHAKSPSELFRHLSLDGAGVLEAPCPAHVRDQCWHPGAETFVADDADVARLGRHVEALRERGVELRAVRSAVLCTQRLNAERAMGKNRFTSDLHAMERLVLALADEAEAPVRAVCGKVGGMRDYSRFFGPLSDRLHTVLETGAAASGYHFPGLGEVYFVRDADASDPLVMLASLVGKYVRELLMGRIARFYGAPGTDPWNVSGYHDPVTARFMAATRSLRKDRRVPDTCFVRDRDDR